MDFAARLREVMNEKGMGVMDLAEVLGVTHPAVLGWLKPEKGSRPYPKTQIALAETFNVRRDWLMHGEGPRESSGPRGRLRQARENAGLTAHGVAKAIGYNVGVYIAVEQGTARASEKMIDALVALLKIDKEDLISGSDYTTVLNESPAFGSFGSKPDLKLPEGSSARYVPLLSWAQAGSFDAGHTDEGYDYQGVISIDVKDPKAFAITVRGNSMEPRIVDGDSIIVCPSWEPHLGDTVVAKTVKGDVLCKIYQSQKSGSLVELSSYNSAYQPLMFKRSELSWIYPVGQVVQNLRRS